MRSRNNHTLPASGHGLARYIILIYIQSWPIAMTNGVITGEHKNERKKETKKKCHLITFLRTPNFYPRHLYHSDMCLKKNPHYMYVIKIVTDKTLIKK